MVNARFSPALPSRSAVGVKEKPGWGLVDRGAISATPTNSHRCQPNKLLRITIERRVRHISNISTDNGIYQHYTRIHPRMCKFASQPPLPSRCYLLLRFCPPTVAAPLSCFVTLPRSPRKTSAQRVERDSAGDAGHRGAKSNAFVSAGGVGGDTFKGSCRTT